MSARTDIAAATPRLVGGITELLLSHLDAVDPEVTRLIGEEKPELRAAWPGDDAGISRRVLDLAHAFPVPQVSSDTAVHIRRFS